MHRNPHPSALKALAKNSKSKTARFVVDELDDVNAGDAEKHTHTELADGVWKGGRIHGFVQHMGGDKFHYNSGGFPSSRSKILRRFEKHGMVKGTMSADVWKTIKV